VYGNQLCNRKYIQHPLRPLRKHQPRLPFAVPQRHRTTRLLHAQHSDQTEVQFVPPDHFLNDLLFLKPALAIFVRPPVPLRQRLRMLDQRLRMKLEPRQKILPPLLEHVVHVVVKMIVATKRQVSFENHPIKTTQQAHAQHRKLFHEPLGKTHGVLLPGRI